MKSLFLSLLTAGFLLGSSIVSGAHAGGGEAKAEGVPGIHFVELSPLILPVIGDHGVSEIVTLVVAVEVDSQEKADQVTKYSPRLTDAFLSDLYGAFSGQVQGNSGIIPVAYLKQRLNKVSAKVMGENVVSDVLLQVMQKRST